MIDLTRQALVITGFVVAMMLVIEYLNVLTSGAWQGQLAQQRWGQYVLAAILGVVPGCLGAFAVVAMYSHGVLTLGAVVTVMIATSGDESFVMLAMIPQAALVTTVVLLLLGIGVGVLVDLVVTRRGFGSAARCEGLAVHLEAQCECFPRGRILAQWKQCSPTRGVLMVALGLFGWAIGAGQLGPSDWSWLRVTLVGVNLVAFLIVATVPEHFLESHLWEHVVRVHAPRIFLWTLGAFIAIHFLGDAVVPDAAFGQGKWLLLLAACLVGLIPESGPHLVFVTLYAQGSIPFSILLASSIVQDGHGMLPMLAHSRKAFIIVKAINFSAGISCGALALGLGY